MQKMKDSGVAWIGDIPEGWEVLPLKRGGQRIVTGGTPAGADEKYYQENGFPWYTPSDFSSDIYLGNIAARSLSELGKTVCKVFPKKTIFMVGIGATIGKVGLSMHEASCNQQINAIICKTIIPTYLAYYLTIIKDYIIKCGKFTTMPIINQEETKALLVSYPSYSKQQAIADYLDRKATQIYTIIAQHKAQIDKLKEYRQSTITEAVTKGLDASVPMKDSGVEWIGEIPVGWRLIRLKHHAKICNGQDYKDVYEEGGEYPVMGSGGVFSRANTFLYNKVSVLLGRKGTIDRPLFVDFPFWTVDTMYYTEIKSNTFAKFFYYLCTTINFQYYQYGSAVPSMTQKDLNEILFTYPPFFEQQAIADYLDNKTAQIDKAIATKEALITKLTEYKQSLIYEAVTGKVEV